MDTAMYAQQNRSEHGDTTTRVEIIYGKKYIVVSHYSKAFKEKLDFLKAKGYEPATATISFILAWKGKDDENETAIILPDVCLNKK